MEGICNKTEQALANRAYTKDSLQIKIMFIKKRTGYDKDARWRR